MPIPRTAGRVIAEELCKKFPEASNHGLARRLAKENPTCFTHETARSIIRTIRGANGKRNRKVATQLRPKGKADAVQLKPPKSIAEEWVPFDLGNDIRVGVISDVHIPYHSETAFETAVSELKKRNPNVLLINGDFADFYQVSRWEKSPLNRRFKEELALVVQGLEWLRQEFGKDCRIVYKMGNHEERWEKYIWNRAPEIYDLPGCQLNELLKLEKFGIEPVDDQRFIMAGKLPIAHGHELPKGLASPVNMARGVFLRTIHTMLVGHGHRTSGHAESNYNHDEVFCWSTGCLCDMTPEYARVNKWNWGFAFVEVGKDGSFDVDNLRISKRGEVRGS
jgi:predicted phosphodiesterase